MSKMKRYDSLNSEIMFLENLHDTLYVAHYDSDDTPAEIRIALELINRRLEVIGKKAKKLSKKINRDHYALMP